MWGVDGYRRTQPKHRLAKQLLDEKKHTAAAAAANIGLQHTAEDDHPNLEAKLRAVLQLALAAEKTEAEEVAARSRGARPKKKSKKKRGGKKAVGEDAGTLRARGNEAFAAGEYAHALQWYHKCE